MAIKKGLKIGLWITGAVAAIVGGYFGVKYLIKPKTTTEPPPTDTTNTGTTGTGTTGSGLKAKPKPKPVRITVVLVTTSYELKANKYTKIYAYAGASAVHEFMGFIEPDEGTGGDDEPFNPHDTYIPSAPSSAVGAVTYTNPQTGQTEDLPLIILPSWLGGVVKVVQAGGIVGVILQKAYTHAKPTDYIIVRFKDNQNKYRYGYVLKKDTTISKTIIT